MTDELEYGLGAIASPADPRDFIVELDQAIRLPRRFVVDGLGPVLNQGTTPMCGGYSGVGLKQHQEKRDGQGVVPFNPAALYVRARVHDGINAVAGTTARGVLKALQKEGAMGGRRPARDYRIASYAAVPFQVEAFKRTLHRTRQPLLVGAGWFRSWFRVSPLPRPAGPAGGHLFLVFAWDDNVAGGSFICRNSWGRYPGSVNGNFYAPYHVLMPNVHDAWTAVDLPTPKQ